MEEIRNKFKENGQEHVFQFWDELNDDQKNDLLNDIKEFDVKKVTDSFKISLKSFDEYKEIKIEPPKNVKV
jgi:UDP-N-acetylglucosamine/UDP-N-acetylgalactosamine diphosphorylase